ncbi:MAG: hypothetical protein CM15mP58_03710 [Burkholderiaceae bacterium]|nr:MAG: hypothetical protein CM15mP58_03710 [Burkholderiaceae bacterium]
MVRMLEGDHSSFGGVNTGVATPGSTTGTEIGQSSGSNVYRGASGLDEDRLEEIKNFMDLINLRTRDLLK